MTLVQSFLSLVVDGALGAWLGSIAFFSFLGAPTTFAVLPREDAGTVVNAIFPKYYLLGVGLGVVALAAAAGGAAVDGLDLPAAALLAATAVAVALFAYSRWVLVPRMDRAGDEGAGEDAFDRYHRQSVVLNGVALAAVAAALVASHA